MTKCKCNVNIYNVQPHTTGAAKFFKHLQLISTHLLAEHKPSKTNQLWQPDVSRK